MRQRSLRIIILLLLLLTTLAACSDEKENPPNATSPAPATLPPEAGRTVPGCERSALENWYEVASPNIRTFQTEALGFTALGQEAMPGAIQRLNELQDAVASAPVPECMIDVQRIAIEVIVQVTANFTAFFNNQIDASTLQTRVIEGDGRFNNEVIPLLNNAFAQLTGS